MMRSGVFYLAGLAREKPGYSRLSRPKSMLHVGLDEARLWALRYREGHRAIQRIHRGVVHREQPPQQPRRPRWLLHQLRNKGVNVAGGGYPEIAAGLSMIELGRHQVAAIRVERRRSPI